MFILHTRSLQVDGRGLLDATALHPECNGARLKCRSRHSVRRLRDIALTSLMNSGAQLSELGPGRIREDVNERQETAGCVSERRVERGERFQTDWTGLQIGIRHCWGPRAREEDVPRLPIIGTEPAFPNSARDKAFARLATETSCRNLSR